MGEEGKKTYYNNKFVIQIKDNYAEVEDMLLMCEEYNFSSYHHQGNQLPKAILLSTDTHLIDFFDYSVEEGSLEEVL